MQNLSNQQVRLYLWIGIAGILAVGFAPLFLTDLYNEGRVPLSFIGFGFSLELLGVGLGTVVCSRVLGEQASARRVAATLIALAVVNAASIFADELLQLLVRFVAGLIGGVLVGATISAIVRSAAPTRNSAIYLTGQTVVQFGIALLLTGLISPRFGSNGSFVVIALFALGALPFTLHLRPVALSQSAEQDADFAPLQWHHWTALLVIGLVMASLSSVVSYSEVHLAALELPQELVDLAIPIVLIGQILGGCVAMVLSGRVSHSWLIPIMILGICASMIALGITTKAPQLLLLYAAVGFGWMFLGPFFVGWLLALDPTYSVARLFAAAQLLGIAVGPLAVGAVDGSVKLTTSLAGAATLAAIVFFFLVSLRAQQQTTPEHSRM
jgi:predicted MFS family arabinose efflux permease